MSIPMTTKPIDRLQQGSHCVDSNGMEWEATDTPGFLLKPIFKDEKTGETTSLMKIEPGVYFPLHAHDQLEEIFVLDGDFFDDDRTYKAGQYCQRAIGAQHTAGSKGGCTVLLVYRA